MTFTDGINQLELPLNRALDIIYYNVFLQTHHENEEYADVAIPYLQGPPGDGKTQMIHNMCKRNNWGFISCHFALQPIEVFTGIPQFSDISVNGQKVLGTIWSIPDIVTKLYDMTNKGFEKIILLLDDLHLCGPTHMAYLYEPLTERSFNGHKIPNNCAIVLAGNQSNKAGAKTPFSAIMNRVQIMPIYQDFNYWKSNYAIPNNVHQVIVSFLSGDSYQKFFREEEQMETPWGSPRSWTRLANLIQMFELNNDGKPLSEEMIQYLSSGHVSKEAASSFSLYYKLYSQINPRKILRDIKSGNYELPEENSQKYIVAYSLTFHMINNGLDEFKKDIEQFTDFILLAKDYNKDLIVMMLKEISEYDNERRTQRFKMVISAVQKKDPTFSTQLLKAISGIE